MLCSLFSTKLQRNSQNASMPFYKKLVTASGGCGSMGPFGSTYSSLPKLGLLASNTFKKYLEIAIGSISRNRSRSVKKLREKCLFPLKKKFKVVG